MNKMEPLNILQSLITNGKTNAIASKTDLDPKIFPSLYGYFDGQIEAYNVVLELIDHLKKKNQN